MTKNTKIVYKRICEIDQIILKLEDEKEELIAKLNEKEWKDFEKLIFNDGKTHII